MCCEPRCISVAPLVGQARFPNSSRLRIPFVGESGLPWHGRAPGAAAGFGGRGAAAVGDGCGWVEAAATGRAPGTSTAGLALRQVRAAAAPQTQRQAGWGWGWGRGCGPAGSGWRRPCLGIMRASRLHQRLLHWGGSRAPGRRDGELVFRER